MSHRHVRLVRSTARQNTAAPPATLDNCEREPIHVPGHIQPHGALVAFEADSSLIRYASTNLKDWLPVGSLPLTGRPLSALVDPVSWQQIEHAARSARASGVRHEIVSLKPAGAGADAAALEAVVHRHHGRCLLEIERAAAQPVDGMQLHADVMDALRGAADLDDLLARLAQQVKRLTGLDRVMVYRFDSDWHGEVAAEAREADMEAFLGLHYPASDIPAQARELYRTNLVRYIADVDYSAVPVQPWADMVSHEPLDMSHSVLRSVSPLHLQYLQNMGVHSTLTMSLVVDGRLWGLVAGHHRATTALPLRVRQVCTALSLGASHLVGAQLQTLRSQSAQRAAHIQQRVANVFNQAEVPLDEAVDSLTAALLSLVGATGGALWHRGELIRFGRWPEEERAAELLAFAQQQLATASDDLQAFESMTLASPLQPGEMTAACGTLVLRLGEHNDSGLMWLRPEFRREISWGGDPDKPVQLALDEQGRPLLSPRASFERWTTLVRGRCRPWTELDLEAARLLLPLRQMLAVRDSLADSRESDRRFRALLELQSDAYWQVDDDGRLVTLSKALPVDLGPLEGRSLPDILAPVCTEASVAELRRALGVGAAFRDLRLTSRLQPGAQDFELLLSGEPLRDRQHRVVGFHGTLDDVSPAMRAGRELRRREAAEMANRTKGRFLSQVSHELRTPLNAVLGYAEILMSDDSTTAAQREQVQHIQKAGQWLLAMITDLLDVARIESGRIELNLRTLALQPQLEQALQTLRLQADAAGVSLQLQAPAAPVWIHADPVRLGQVLLNLIGNAVKYNRQGGSVTVTLAPAKGPQASVAVRDTGPGLDAAQLTQIFQPFNRLGRENQQTPGTGIGLVIARQLAEAMGGHIEVSSEPGMGSCFTLSLVAAQPDDLSSDASEAFPPEAEDLNRQLPQPRRTRLQPMPGVPLATVLYVEDEPTNAALMQALVDATGAATLLHAPDAETGLILAREARPALMLIDLNLPGKDGAWLLQAVRADPLLATTHCIAVTADAMRDTLLRLRALGFDQCWTKPLELRWTGRALLAAIEGTRQQPHRAPLHFDDADALSRLVDAGPAWLDTLDFGVVRLDAALHVTAYNLFEARHTGYEPEAVIGRDFFADIAPCMNKPPVAGRLRAARPLDATLDYVFRLRQRHESVRLRLLADPGLEHRFLLVDRLA